MKQSFTLLVLIIFSLLSLSAQEENPTIYLGKRGMTIFDRKISEFNLGRFGTAGRRIFFKVGEQDDFQGIGFFGQKILPYLQDDQLAMEEFDRYRKNRIAAFSASVISSGCMLGWLIRTSDNIEQSRGNTIAQVLFTEPGAAVLLASGITSSLASSLLFMKSDIDLFNAVQLFNSQADYGIRPNLKPTFNCIAWQQQIVPSIGLTLTW